MYLMRNPPLARMNPDYTYGEPVKVATNPKTIFWTLLDGDCEINECDNTAIARCEFRHKEMFHKDHIHGCG